MSSELSLETVISEVSIGLSSEISRAISAETSVATSLSSKINSKSSIDRTRTINVENSLRSVLSSQTTRTTNVETSLSSLKGRVDLVTQGAPASFDTLVEIASVLEGSGNVVYNLVNKDTSLDARITQVDASLNEIIDEVDQRLDSRITQVDASLNEIIDEVDQRLDARIDVLEQKYDASGNLVINSIMLSGKALTVSNGNLYWDGYLVNVTQPI
jgi:hypothetical protein